jgi:hypothetical protein
MKHAFVKKAFRNTFEPKTDEGSAKCKIYTESNFIIYTDDLLFGERNEGDYDWLGK